MDHSYYLFCSEGLYCEEPLQGSQATRAYLVPDFILTKSDISAGPFQVLDGLAGIFDLNCFVQPSMCDEEGFSF